MEKTVNISGRQGEGVIPGQAQRIGQQYLEHRAVTIQVSGSSAVSNALRAILTANEQWIEPRQWFRITLIERPRLEGGTFTTIRMDVSDLDQAAWQGESPFHQIAVSNGRIHAFAAEIADLILIGGSPVPVKICSSETIEESTAIKAISHASRLVLGHAGHDLYVALQYKRKPMSRDDYPPIELVVIPVRHCC